METKTYEIQDQSFSLISNDLNLLNKAAPMIARLRKLTHEYTKDIDLSAVKEYHDRIDDLKESAENLQALIDSGKDETGEPLTEIVAAQYRNDVVDYTEKTMLVIDQLAGNEPLQALLGLKAELEGYALIELLTDIDFVVNGYETNLETGKKTKRWGGLGSILTGGEIKKVDFTDASVIGFIKDVCVDFFTAMSRSNLKA